MLFEAARVYAPGEAGSQGLPRSGDQDVSVAGRYDLSQIAPPNVLLALVALLVIAYVMHHQGSRRKR